MMKVQQIIFRSIAILALVSGLATAQKLYAQDTLVMNLSDAIAVGLEQNYQIRVSRQEVRIARNNNEPGAAGRYPSINFTAVQGNSFDNSESRTSPGERDKLTTNFIAPSVDLTWTLFDGFRVNITKKNLEALEEFSEGLSAVVVENTIQSIILAYYNVLLQQEKLEVFGELKALSGDRMKYMEARRRFGNAVTFDVLQANDAYLSDSVNYLQQELNVQNARLLLKLLLALDENTGFRLTESFDVQLGEYVLDTLEARMFRNNKTLMNQYINQKLYEYSTDLAKSDYYPGLYFGAGADYANTRIDYASQPASTGYSFGYYANFTLSFNLYNGGATRRAVENARINEEIGLINITELRKTLGNQLVNQYDLYNIRKNLLVVADASRESTGLNLQI
ncbi:MAG: TolC family protein, partial [Bacteroidales bacterium]